MSKQEDFLLNVMPYAYKSSRLLKEKGINVKPEFIASQWAHETGYGTNKGFQRNNLAGMYAYPSSPYGLGGKPYKTLDDFVEDYVLTLSNKRYAGINNTDSVTDFAVALRNGGYATDPEYAYAGVWTESVNILSRVTGIKKEEKPIKEINDYIESTEVASNVGWFNFENPIDKVLDFVKIGFVQLLIFVLVLFFLYGSLIKEGKRVSS